MYSMYWNWLTNTEYCSNEQVRIYTLANQAFFIQTFFHFHIITLILFTVLSEMLCAHKYSAYWFLKVRDRKRIMGIYCML